MDQIYCQKEHGEKDGCYQCGGTGVVLQRAICCIWCKKTGWVMPGQAGGYVGKSWTTFDGLHLFVKHDGNYCEKCFMENPH